MDQGHFILDLYRSRFVQVFQHHPDAEAAVARLVSGECSTGEVDRLFAEAEYWSWKALLRARGKDNGDGTVTFERAKPDA